MSSQEQNPKFIEKVGSLLKSLTIWASAGCPVVNEEEYVGRINICAACDKCELDKDNVPIRCKLCGCSLSYKVPLSTSKCPLDKWL